MKLKTCPFCGSSATPAARWILSGWSNTVFCEVCEAQSGSCETARDAAQAWNLRSPQAPAAVALTEAQREALDAGAASLDYAAEYVCQDETESASRRELSAILRSLSQSTSSEGDEKSVVHLRVAIKSLAFHNALCGQRGIAIDNPFVEERMAAAKYLHSLIDAARAKEKL